MRHAIQTLQHALFLSQLSIITESEAEFGSLPRHSPRLPQREASCEFQPRLVSWVPTAVTSQVPEAEIYFFKTDINSGYSAT